MVSVPARRSQVAFATAKGLSQRRACTPVKVGRSAFALSIAKAREGRGVLARMTELAAVSALWLPTRSHLSWPRRSQDSVERIGCGRLQRCRCRAAAEETHRQRPTAAQCADGCEPGVELRLRVRLVRQRSEAQVPDGDRRGTT